jgi:hypothetical protein
MKRPILIAVIVTSFAGAGLSRIVHAPYAYAQDAIDQNKADTLHIDMFMRPPGDKAYVCFMRRYDAESGATSEAESRGDEASRQHDIPEGEKRLAYSFQLGEGGGIDVAASTAWTHRTAPRW